jgi:hypothetical protein
MITTKIRPLCSIVLAALALTGAAGCGGGGVSNPEDAKRAYEGLDASIDKAIQLGFDGFNEATSASIPPQTGKGAKTGTIVIAGKVDQGSSDNKTMDLTIEMKQYSDDGVLTYDTLSALPTLSMKLSKIPTGTIDGTLGGTFGMTGQLEGEVTLALSFVGDLQPNETDDTKVERKPGTTHITGTASSDFGTYDVDITR